MTRTSALAVVAALIAWTAGAACKSSGGDAGDAAAVEDASAAIDAASTNDGASSSEDARGLDAGSSDTAGFGDAANAGGDAGAAHDGGAPDASGAGDAATCDPLAMPRPNEGLVEEPGTGGCPSGMVLIPPHEFCVDRFEASLVEVLAGGSTRSFSPYFNPGMRQVRAVSLRGAVPQAYIDGINAGRACMQAGKRLCTDTEWQRGCRGPQTFIYPYGNTRMNGVCNDARAVHPIVELFPNDPTFTSAHLNNACVDQLPMSLDKTGERSGCVTAEGMFDMMGNLHEWTADPNGTFRGGFYVDTRLNGNGCLYATTAHNTAYWDYSTGFRCCADAP